MCTYIIDYIYIFIIIIIVFYFLFYYFIILLFFCRFNARSYFERALVLLDDNVGKKKLLIDYID